VPPLRPSVDAQRRAYEHAFGDEPVTRWDFNFTDDRLIRFLRDRRLTVALKLLASHGAARLHDSVLVVCGGVGGEGVFLLNHGYGDVTVSDISPSALAICSEREPRLKTRVLDAEDMREVADGEYDMVLVQDGLHHLPRPVLGFTEMLRVARRSVVVIEPHEGLVAKTLGTTWEQHDDAVNYVFRWTGGFWAAVARSYLGKEADVAHVRLWDHSGALHRAVSILPERFRLRAAKLAYGVLAPANRAGQMMVGVVVKSPST
jgi:ubiquinone/menaquinone biosynthesis C-methylase UbiE